MIALGTSDMAKAYVGSTEVSKMYLGSDLVYENAPSLPYDAEIQYLESDGYSYLDTEIPATNDIIFILDLFFPAYSGSDVGKWVFGARVSTTSKQLCLSVYPGRANHQANWGYSGKQNVFYKDFNNGRFVLSNTTSKHKLDVDGVTVSTSTSTASFSTHDMYIFAMNNNGSLSSVYEGLRLNSAKMYSGSDIIRDMKPVRVGQVGYMYDKISKRLFGNAADSGAFVLGNDV